MFIPMLIFGLICAPILGCLLAGVDRKITARMQGRVGPSILQPYSDFRKLLAKDTGHTNRTESVYIFMYLLFVVIATVLFFLGGNFLLVVFVLTLGVLFFILAAYAPGSPYASIGANREILAVMAYEPMVLLVAAGLYLATGTFDVVAMTQASKPAIIMLPLLFLGFIYVLTIKLRKSPFDLSMSHHAHQELVRGMTTEMNGQTLAMVELAHWYESILYLGWVALFVIWKGWVGLIVALLVAALVYFLEILVDNNFARMKWEFALKSSWWLALILGLLNLGVILLLGLAL